MRFPLQVLGTLAAGLVTAALFFAGDEAIMPAVVAGGVLSALNAIAGFVAIERSLGKSTTAFLKAVLGGMGVRLAAMLIIVVGLITMAGMHRIALVVSVLSFYAVFLILELLHVQRSASARSNTQDP